MPMTIKLRIYSISATPTCATVSYTHLDVYKRQERYDRRKQTKDDYVFRRKGMELPMTPSTFTWRFKKILKANDLPTDLNLSLIHI